MNRINYKLPSLLITAFIVLILSISISAEAASSNKNSTSTPSKEHPITVDADNQQIDIEKDLIIFTGNVIAVQDTLKVKAREITIQNMSSKDDQIITAYGSPVYFEQAIETNRGPDIVKGNGKKLVYNIKTNTLILTGDGIVYKKDSTVKGEQIVYDLDNNTIKATSGKGNRVHTTIKPADK